MTYLNTIAFSSPEASETRVLSDRNLSVVYRRHRCRRKVFTFYLLFKNHWANVNQTCKNQPGERGLNEESSPCKTRDCIVKIRWLSSKFLNQCAAALTDGFVAQVSDVTRSRNVYFSSK